MKQRVFALPSFKLSLITLLVVGIYLSIETYFFGFQRQTAELVTVALILMAIFLPVRQFVGAFLPFIVYGVLYSMMRICPNYLVAPVDIAGIYNAELKYFGIATVSGVVTPNEFFALHHWAWADLLAGVSYMCWVPLPLAYGFWLYFTGRRALCFRFSVAFLLVNLVGFVIYYIHPAAPPWYVMKHGFEMIPGTPGDTGAFIRVDHLLGVPIFQNFYCHNANVFAAMPSLHSAYVPVALYYALVNKEKMAWIVVLSVVMFLIWFTAIYSWHHYMLDVLAGIVCVVVGLLLWEGVLIRIPCVNRWFHCYTKSLT